MDMSVKPEDVTKVLQDVRELIKDNLIPRITELECQNYMLRKIAWPVCQLHFEKSQLDSLNMKAKALYGLSRDEIISLLLSKERIAKDIDGYNPYKMGRADQEYEEIKKYILKIKYGSAFNQSKEKEPGDESEIWELLSSAK